jgi:hypothetical protein
VAVSVFVPAFSLLPGTANVTYEKSRPVVRLPVWFRLELVPSVTPFAASVIVPVGPIARLLVSTCTCTWSSAVESSEAV